MKNLIICAAVLLITGCANPLAKWTSENRPLAEQGAMPWSTYYERLYQQLAASDVSNKGAMMQRVNTMISAAKSYERHEITEDQFQFMRRKMEAEQQAEADAASHEKRQAFAKALQKAGENTRDRAPTYVPIEPIQPPIQTTHCSSYLNQVTCTTQ